MAARLFRELTESGVHQPVHDSSEEEFLLRGRLMAGQLTLDQLVEVRILCPQHKDPFERGSFRLSRKLPRMARVYT